ncbi:IclR family transcriptional regulator [Demequina sp. NBRC 110054]|uniref:IclR family transcriptional regulator n=1 Tax=Demequina sp. NBRC 110054 TaxID=1570343 RepID=UPI000A06F6CF|nr:IclR family transcriptional regulator C-terminal domain-containing protein [Demequina sp. NBRC 110054]
MTANASSSLDRALSLLMAFADPDSEQRVFTVSALAERMQMDKAQVSRTLATFAQYGLVERLENRRGYQLGWASIHLAGKAMIAQTMSAIYPELAVLSAEVEETVWIAVRSGSRGIALETFEPDRSLQVRIVPGKPFPLVGSAMGEALLSQSCDDDVRALHKGSPRPRGGSLPTVRETLDRVALAREQGYGLVVDERAEQVTSLAVPIVDVGNYSGRVFAAIAISAPDARFPTDSTALRERLLEIASNANAFLEGRSAGA